MRASLVALFLMLPVAGCINGGPAMESPVCAESCAILVDGSDKRTYESSIARNPIDPHNIIIVSSSWRGLSDGSGPVEMEVHVSFDNGTSFESFRFPGAVAPEHPLATAQTLADPWVVFLEDGSALVSAMVGRGVQGPREALVPAWESFDIAVARSTDGGLTWPTVAFVSDTPGLTGLVNAGTMNDQPFMVVGPGGDVFIQWIIHEFEPDQSGRHDIWSSVSQDGGMTWSEPVRITGSGTFRGGVPAATVGEYVVAIRDVGTDGQAGPVHIARSEDGGATWDVTGLEGASAGLAPQMVAHGETLWLVYGSPGPDAPQAVHLRRSDDGGLTWSDEVLARSQSVGETMPAVAVAPDGTLFVTYYLGTPDGRAQPTATRITADGMRTDVNLTEFLLEPPVRSGILGWTTYGDYQGLWADRYGAIGSWLGGVPHDTDLMMSRFQG